MDKVVFSRCYVHEGCTLKAGFAEATNTSFDISRDLQAVPELVQLRAEEAFGPVFCVGTEHLTGVLTVARDVQ